jgi:hypothetical protein
MPEPVAPSKLVWELVWEVVWEVVWELVWWSVWDRPGHCPRRPDRAQAIVRAREAGLAGR